MLWQLIAVLVTPVYAFVATYGLLRLVNLVLPVRASDHEQAIGMDVVQHGEQAYVSGEGAILIEPDGVRERDRDRLVAEPV